MGQVDESRKKPRTVEGISDERAVELFRELLRFETVSQTGHYSPDGKGKSPNERCVEFLQGICHQLGLQTTVLPGPEPSPKPILLATWVGEDPTLPTLLLNSHYDVVPVLEEHWDKPYFEGALIDDPSFPLGPRIYGRGAQDMKCVCIQYLVAISRLIAAGFTPRRTVHLSFVPDEEVGGTGMAYFTESEAFKKLNVVVAMDEGLCNPTTTKYTAFFGERTPWWVEVNANGPTGHGSRFIKGTATHCLHAFLSRALAFRKQQERELHGGDEGGCSHAKCKKLGDVTTVNLTVLRAGVTKDGGKTYAVNVIPTEASASLDVRIPVTLPHDELEQRFTEWCREAEKEWDAPEGTLSWRFSPYAGPTLHSHHVTDTSAKNPFWGAFKAAAQKSGVEVDEEVFPAATDSRFLRALGITAIGFSPINSDPILLHEHNEYLSKSVFVKGCAVYEGVIPAVANVCV